MLDGIEALIALEKYETISLAAIRLRLTQSAVSKRLMALEADTGLKLLEPRGRKVKLTARAIEFLAKAKPLFYELKNLKISSADANQKFHFSLGLSDSIAGSFGPLIVQKALTTLDNLSLDYHVHRSLLLLENISLGKYQMGICTYTDERKELISFKLGDEPLVLINPEIISAKKNLPLIMIEENSATWRASGAELKKEHPSIFVNGHISVESFLAVYQMSKVGIGMGVMPKIMAHELGLRPKQYKKLRVTRPISLVTRKTIAELPFFNPFYESLKKSVAEILKN